MYYREKSFHFILFKKLFDTERPWAKIDGDGNENWLNKRFNEQNNSSARAS